MKNAMRADQVAQTVVALCSPDCKLTGQILSVRGNEVVLFNQPRPIKSLVDKEGWTPKKLLDSAIANAEHNKGLDIDNLFISKITVDEALLFKRIQTRARGRADRIQKRNCHVNITLENTGN